MRVGQLGIIDKVACDVSPVFDLAYTAARVFIQRDIVFLNQLGVVVAYEPGQVFGQVFARLGYIVAESMHDFVADTIMIGSAPLKRKAFEFGIKVDSVPGNFEQPSHVIDSMVYLTEPRLQAPGRRPVPVAESGICTES